MVRCVKIDFSADGKVLIKSLSELKGYNAPQFMWEFSSKGWTTCRLYRLLKKLMDTGTVDRHSGILHFITMLLINGEHDCVHV